MGAFREYDRRNGSVAAIERPARPGGGAPGALTRILATKAMPNPGADGFRAAGNVGESGAAASRARGFIPGGESEAIPGGESEAMPQCDGADLAWLNRPGRRVFCCDMDTFFVSVERLFDPSLVGKPVIVGGPKNARGVVAACSYEAREYGIKSGMSLYKAGELCPHAEFVYGRGHDFAKFSEEVRHILEERLPDVRAASIDEFFIELTGISRIYPDLDLVGRTIRREVYVRTGLPMTIGGGRNRLVAKVASSFAKPNGLHIVPEGAEAAWLAPMHVQKMPGIGPKTAEALESIGIFTLGQLAAADRGALAAKFGLWGGYIWEKAHGREVGIYQPGSIPHSIGNESTFRADVDDLDRVREILRSLLERACFRMRREGLRCAQVAVKLRYADFDTHTAQARIPRTDEDEVVWPVADHLLHCLNVRRAAIRLVGVRLSALTFDRGQMEMFRAYDETTAGDEVSPGRLRFEIFPKPEDGDTKSHEIAAEPDGASVPAHTPAAGFPSRGQLFHSAVDAIRERFGYDAIGTGPAVKRIIEKKKRRSGVGEAGGLEVARPQNVGR